MTASKLVLSAASGVGGAGLDIEEVFSTDLFQGTSSSKTITNGLDLSGEGGLVWVKDRETNDPNFFFDTERPVTSFLRTDSNAAQQGRAFVFRSVAFGNNIHIAATSHGFYRSTDGTTWSAVTDSDVAGVEYLSVKYLNNRFVALNAGRKWATSTDGTNWTVTDLPGYTVATQGPFYANGRYMVRSQGQNVFIT